MGAAISRRLIAEGHYVVGVEIAQEAAELDEDEISQSGELVGGDVADVRVLRQAAERAVAIAPLIGWVNNAAVAIPGTLHNLDEQAVRRVIDVNLLGVFYGAAAAVQTFLRQETGGAIVNISSIQGQAAFPGWAAYIAAKGGVDAFTRYIAVEYGPAGIRANAIAPGNIRTPLVQRVIETAPDPKEMSEVMATMHPLGRLGEPEEVASLAAFLISDEASLISGQVIAIDGGATARCYPMHVDADLVDDNRRAPEADR
jgi:NAD(P)-dependent dehydrogenase (short-subunit alcohol dehydrogenase family)